MHKMLVGICDDDPLDLSDTLSLLRNYDKNDLLNILSFNKASDILDYMVTMPIDIVVLDIEMSPPNGFDIAKVLLKQKKPPVIIFSTKSNAYALKGYGIALRYLQKPLQSEELSEALDAAIAEATAHRVILEADGIAHAILISSITYVEVYGHYCEVHYDGEKIVIRKSLKELLSELPISIFVCPHKSYIVNMEKIRSASATVIRLDDGTSIPISRKRANDFSVAFYRFLGR